MSDWIRHGECNGCGDCCRQATNCLTLLIPIQDEAYGRVRYGAPHPTFLGNDGAPVFEVRGPVYLPCPKLDGDLCTIHDIKPQYCKDTPCAPEDIEGLPRCSYWFEHRVTGEIRGRKSVKVEVDVITIARIAGIMRENAVRYEGMDDERVKDSVSYFRELAGYLENLIKA